MSLRRMMAGMGVGGASVETVLAQPNAQPGGTVSGTVTVLGGKVDQQVESVSVALAARVEVEAGDHEFAGIMPFAQQQVWGAFLLAAGARHAMDFTVTLPWEAPVTTVGGRHLRGMFVGVQTLVEIARSVDKGDLDQIFVHPLPAQERILTALGRLGFGIKSADLERGYIRGSAMPFYQEIEYYPSPEFARYMNELEVTFLAGGNHMDVVLEADNRGSLFSEGRDTYSRFPVHYATAGTTDWEHHIHGVLRQMATRRGWH